jgi:predicted nucleic acid-binding protein
VRSGQATVLYQDSIRAGRPIVAPPLLPIEVTNILRQRTRASSGLPIARAIELLDVFLAFSIDFYNPPDLHRRALILADALGLPATYDAHYLALAESLGCDLWTDDQRLLRQIGNRLPFVRRLGDYGVSAATT